MLKYFILSVVALISYGSAIDGHSSVDEESFSVLSHEISSLNVNLSSQDDVLCIISRRCSTGNTRQIRDNKKSKNNNNYKYGWYNKRVNSNICYIIQEKHLSYNIIHIESVDILTKFCRLII